MKKFSAAERLKKTKKTTSTPKFSAPADLPAPEQASNAPVEAEVGGDFVIAEPHAGMSFGGGIGEMLTFSGFSKFHPDGRG